MNNVPSNAKQQQMRSMLHILVLLICCNLITYTTGTTHTATAAVTSMLATASQRNMPHNWLRRQRRYLMFQKGSSFLAQVVGTKAILPEYPSGLFQVFEITAYYELPTSLDDLWPQRTKAHSSATTTKHNATTSAAAMHTPKLGTFSGSNGYSNYNYNNNDEMWLPTWHATDDWPAAAAMMPTWWQVPGQRRQWLSAHNKQQQLHRKQQKLHSKQQTRRKQQQTRKQYFARQQHRFPSPWQEAKSFTFMPPILSRQFAAYPVVQQDSVCSRRNVYGSWQDKNAPRLCAPGSKTLGRGRKRRSIGAGDDSVGVGVGVAGGKENNDDAVHRFDERPDEFHFATNAERIFFDLLTQWTQVHNYPSHYCIMRTFCEARHVLLARGQSLFHDLLRILIEAAMPAARRHATYKKAISHDNLSDCAQHYATLCGLSFLQHFSEAVHGRFMQ
ncbi:PREDICTED: uncharacterized protein LOC108975151 isoform X1 [Bactrocera latifrons]|uniref:uncharacterized protein LOC108975151 isoform X1 n=1 Tax=Bactrocera latifrons TaxID=174628 RepID=UPI0008DD05A2|nr:PREDICTED: uncharacterized protein LOC108975151 isoform X1 [Bactrocera latifrons]